MSLLCSGNLRLPSLVFWSFSAWPLVFQASSARTSISVTTKMLSAKIANVNPCSTTIKHFYEGVGGSDCCVGVWVNEKAWMERINTGEKGETDYNDYSHEYAYPNEKLFTRCVGDTLSHHFDSCQGSVGVRMLLLFKRLLSRRTFPTKSSPIRAPKSSHISYPVVFMTIV